MDATEGRLLRDYIAFEIALHRARADFMEMPGLRLTPFQAQRLWTLEADLCRAVLQQLVESRFLTQSGSNTFIRAAS
jgi:hypothetical protein